jgi:CheY-like chemotaxis protein
MHDGLGLGLAIVRHLAELHGGSVAVTSEGADKGAAFTVNLPASLVSAKTAELTQTATTNGHKDLPLGAELNGIRILIVDDDVDTCEMLIFAFGLLGAEAQCCGSVPDAFIALDEKLPDVILTDINMPGEDGYSFLGKLRALPADQGSEIPAIAITAMARPEDSEKILSAGFQLHLPKPLDIEELSEKIISVVQKAKR